MNVTQEKAWTPIFNRNRRERGLWLRTYDKSWYVQMNVPGKGTRKIRLFNQDGSDVSTVHQAIAAAHVQRNAKGELVAKRVTPPAVTVENIIEAYKLEQESLRSKRSATVKRESSGLKKWTIFCGPLDAAKVVLQTALDFAAWRRRQGVSGRAVDLDVIAFRHALRKYGSKALDEWQKMAKPPKAVRLIEESEIDALCADAEKNAVNHHGQAPSEHGKIVSEYIRLLSLTGAREKEAFHLTRARVNWQMSQVRIGQRAEASEEDPNVAKNKRARTLEMNPGLKAHLESMWARRGWAKQCSCEEGEALLFPSPRSDTVVVTFRKTLTAIKQRTGIANFGWHHLRHFFISHCVMAGIDYMTIAAWVGHSDGGVLIGKTYAHLNNAHRLAAAARVNIGTAA